MQILADENISGTVIRMLRDRGHDDDWAGHFSVVTDDQVRMRPLPSVD